MAKMTITPEDSSALNVQYNPASLQLLRKVHWSQDFEGTKQMVLGLGSGYYRNKLQFKNISFINLEFTLYFDSTNRDEASVYDGELKAYGTDDTCANIKQIEELAMIDTESHHPPLIKVAWDQMTYFEGAIAELEIQYIRFSDAGKPTRARVDLRMVGRTGNEKEGTLELQSPDHTKMRMLRAGDSLEKMASREYEDPRKWRVIAEHNNIDDPHNIPPGTMLELPPIV